MAKGTGFGGGGSSSAGSGRGSGFGGGKSTKKAAAPEAKKPGLLGQVTDIVKAGPSAISALAKAAVEDAPTLATGGVLAGASSLREGTLLKVTEKQRQAEAEKAAGLGVEESLSQRPGFADQMAGSIVRTASRLGSIVPSLTPGGQRPSQTRLARDYRDAPVASLLEDASNVAIVGAPAAKVLGAGASAAGTAASKASAAGNVARAGRLAKAESALRTTQQVVRGAEHPANLVANAGDPIFLTARAAGLAKRGLKSEALRATGVGSKLAGRAESFTERRAVRQDLADLAADISKEQDRQGRVVARQKELLPDPAEVEATTLVRQGETKALAHLDNLPEPERARVLGAVFRDGRAVSPEAFSLARAYETGTMPVDQAARFDEAIALVEREQQQPRTSREVAGIGRKEGPLSPEQLGDQPLTPVVEGAVRPLRVQARRAEEAAARLRRRADQAQRQAAGTRDLVGARASERAEFNSLARPATTRQLTTPGENRGIGAADMRARVFGNVAKSAEARAGRLQTKLANETRRVSDSIEAAPKRFRPALQRAADSRRELGRMAAEAQATGDSHSAAYLRSVADDLPRVIADLTARGVDPSHLIGGESPQFLGGSVGKKQRFPTLRKTGGERRSKTTNITRSAEGQGALEARRAAEAIKNVGAVEFRDKYGKTADALGIDPALTGDDLKRAALERGYKAFDVAALLEGPQKVTRESVFVRTAMADDFSRWFDNARPGNIVGALHRVNRAMSVPILRLSPRWQVGNAVSQAMQLTVGAGMTPLDIVHYGREAARLLKEHPEQVPARFGHSGQFSGLLGPDLDSLGRPLKSPRTPIGKLAEKSGELNNWVDRWGKETVYLAKKAKGYSDAAAVKRALELQVDMRNLSNFERNYVQAALPYYAWAKHITKLSLRLPVEHPARVAWTLHLADLYGDDQSQLPEWLKGGVRLGDGRFVNVGSVVNPFGDVAQSPLLSPGGALSALSPAIRLGGAALNVDVPKAQLLRRPTGTGPMDESGKPKVGLIGVREFASVAAQSLPQTRLAAGLAGTPVSRYPTGDPYLDRSGAPYPTGRTRLNMLGRFVGVPTPEAIDAEAIVAGAADERARTLKTRANYLKKKETGRPVPRSSSGRGRGFGNK